MRIFDGKQYRDLTTDELTEIETAQRKAEIVERRRPLTESEVSRMIITQQINTLAVDDQTALRMIEYYPTFEELIKCNFTAEQAGYKFTFNNILYKTVQPNTNFIIHYEPGIGTESMYTRIDEEHDGSKFDPIPYEGNMALENDKYYTQNGIIYHCTRDTGNPVYNTLADLVGLYVEIVM